MSRPFVVLRPEPGNGRTASALAGAGLEARRLPLFEIAPLAWDAPDPAQFDALLLTSPNAVRCAGAPLAVFAALPVYAVGAATAHAARNAGLAVVFIGSGGADALAEAAAERGVRRALHLAGRARTLACRPPIEAIVAVYTSEPRAIAPGAAAILVGSVALVHSRRAATRLGEVVAAIGLPRARISVAAISDGVREALGEGWRALGVAAAPNDRALIAAARRLAD